MQIKEIHELPKIVRLAGYLARLALLDEVGAKLRTSKEDEDWTQEEEERWYTLVDEIENWEYGLSREEHNLLKPISSFMACLCRGEDPEEHLKLTCEFLKKEVNVEAKKTDN